MRCVRLAQSSRGAAIAVVLLSAGGLPPARPSPAAAVTATYTVGLDSLGAALAEFSAMVAASSAAPPRNAPPAVDTATVRRGFRHVRAAYKRVEFLMAYVDSASAAALNGPGREAGEQGQRDVDADDVTDGEAPSGGVLQALEQTVWRSPFGLDARTRRMLDLEVAGARATVARARAVADHLVLRDGDIFDAARVEMARVLALGLAGDDSRFADDGVIEAAAALAGTRDALVAYATRLENQAPGAWRALDTCFASASAALRAHPDFDSFDRLRFIVQAANPLSRALARAARTLGVQPAATRCATRRPWRLEAATLFEAGAFDPLAHAPCDAPVPTGEIVTLGALLFSDPALSGAGTRACASCHHPERTFTDGRARAQPLPPRSRPAPSSSATGPRAPLRNTPTLLDVAFADALFADGRVSSLEDQVSDVVTSPTEMAGSLDSAARRLAARPAVAARFARAFGDASPSTAVTPHRIRWALAAYERTLTASDTRVDRALRGDSTALTASERRGFTVFMGKGRCGTCHYLPLFSGMRPPDYAHADFEVLGVPRRADTARAEHDSDPGRFAVTHAPEDMGAMRTPTLRFISRTAPYMHNGAYRTLAEVVDFYDRGGRAGVGGPIPNQTLSATPLHLSASEKRDLIAFLGALSDSGR